MRYIDDSGNVNHICETCRYNFRAEYSYPCYVCAWVGANNTDMWSLDEECTKAYPFKNRYLQRLSDADNVLAGATRL